MPSFVLKLMVVLVAVLGLIALVLAVLSGADGDWIALLMWTPGLMLFSWALWRSRVR